MIAARFDSNGAVRTCSSTAWNPASRSRNAAGPMASIVDSPMAESIEYRPPTQSQKPNMFAVSMPNSSTSALLVDTATKCLATSASGPSPSSSHDLALRAFVIVSSVVNVLDETTNSVSAGSRSMTASAKSVPSTLLTNRNTMSRRL